MSEMGVLKVNLNIHQVDEKCIFSCGIQNIGNSLIGLNNTFLFIDEGIYNDETHQYEFPFLQQKFLHLEGIADEDCIGCALCRKGECKYPIEYQHINRFYSKYKSDPFCKCYPLSHLSSQSILYMAPKEEFSEDVVVQIDKGVYRAILMCVPDQSTCDCLCCNKCFCII